MTCALLDTNVLLALLDPFHTGHDRAHEWFSTQKPLGWATCPIVQNGYIRIASQPTYPNPVDTGEALSLLHDFVKTPSHLFWPDSISLIDAQICNPARLVSPKRVTDSYLLALAKANDGQLATFDAKLNTSAIEGGEAHLIHIA